MIPLRRIKASFIRRIRRYTRGGVPEGETRGGDRARREGTSGRREHPIIERVLRLEETSAWDIMTPRVDIFAWPASRRLSDIASELRGVRFSRVPVYGDTIDDIVGVLYTRDVYQALVSGLRDVSLGELAREPFLLPGSVPVTRLLGDFQARRIHLGIVMDEYGGTDGLITLEDILEELVGEIMDETDAERPSIVRVSRNEVTVEGGADLREVNHFFNASFPLLEYRSVNGYLLEELGRVPRTGEEFEREGVLIRISEATETQVVRAQLVRPHVEVGAEEE
jgi:CBS domain containing-hemolysin-like protein